MKGHLKRIIGRKGFGFIEANRKEYFFHRQSFNGHWQDLVDDHEGISAAHKTRTEPIELEFEPTTSPKGLRAENVSRTDFPNQ